MRRLFTNCDILAAEKGKFKVIRGGCLGVNGSVIDYIGKAEPVDRYDLYWDMSGRLLMPGLVNAHTHTPMTLLRGVGSGLALQQWLFDTVFPIEDRLTPELIRTGTELAMLEMIASGTTSFSDMYMEPRETVEAALEAGLRANICRPVQCFDSSERPEDNFRVKESLKLFDQYDGAGEGRIKVDFCVHAEYTCTADVVRYYAGLVRERRGNMHIHLSETKKEHDECAARYGATPARWFADLGAFDSRAFAAHCVWVTEDDIKLMGERGISAVHCPTSNMKLGSGFAPVRKMMDMGVNVALGTDGAASNNNLNMMEELHLASVIHMGRTGDPTLIKPEEVIRMATVNGARLQGREDTGELAVGKKADIIALDITRPHNVPNLDPLALIAYCAQGADVVMTMVDGKLLYDNGRFLTLDAQRICLDALRAVETLYGKEKTVLRQ